jgi:hypothetical protein
MSRLMDTDDRNGLSRREMIGGLAAGRSGPAARAG